MSESNGSNKIWMVIALVATAAAIWFALRGPAVQPAPAQAAPTPEAAPSLPVAASPAAAELPAGASPVWPQAPEVGDEPALKIIEGNFIQDPKHALKLIDKAIEDAGGEDALARWQDATWRRTSDESGAALSGELLHQGGKMAVRSDPATGRSTGWRGGSCWVDRGEGLVTACTLEDHAKMVLAQAIHDATVLLPLRKGVYKLVKTGVFEHEGRNVNRYEYALQGTDWQLTMLQEPADLRPLRLTVGRGDRSMEPLHCDLGTPRKFDGLQVATMRRFHFQPRTDAGDRADDPPYTEVITDVMPGVDKARMTPLKPVVGTPVRIAKRRALAVVEGQCPSHGGLFDALIATEERIPRTHNTLQPDWFEVLGSGDDAAGLSAGLKVWVAPLSAGGVVADAGFRNIGAQERVARQVVMVPVAEVPARFAAFIAEVRKLGHTVKAGAPRVVQIIDVPATPKDLPADAPAARPEDGPWTVELQLVIEPK